MKISAQSNKDKRLREQFKFSRSSQAAMEFLMTYGWAILVVLAAIAALAYFGVLSPEKFLPEKCVLEPGLACIAFKVEPSQVTMVITNSKGNTITMNSITVGGCSTTFNAEMQSGTDKTFVVTGCSNGALKEKFKSDITLAYTLKDTNLTKTAYGNINSKVE